MKLASPPFREEFYSAQCTDLWEEAWEAQHKRYKLFVSRTER